MMRLHKSIAKAMVTPANAVVLPRHLPERIPREEAFQALATNKQIKFLLVPVHVDRNHWCGICTDVVTGVIMGFDPQQAFDRIARLQALVTKQIVPLPPSPKAGRSYKTKALTNVTAQVDNYNCGVYVLQFFESMLTSKTMVDLHAAANRVEMMQCYRFK